VDEVTDQRKYEEAAEALSKDVTGVHAGFQAIPKNA